MCVRSFHIVFQHIETWLFLFACFVLRPPMDEVNHIFLHTVVQYLFFRPFEKITIARIMSQTFWPLGIESTKFLSLCIWISSIIRWNTLLISAADNIQPSISQKAGRLVFPSSLSKATNLYNHIWIMIPDDFTSTKGRIWILYPSSLFNLPIAATKTQGSLLSCFPKLILSLNSCKSTHNSSYPLSDYQYVTQVQLVVINESLLLS